MFDLWSRLDVDWWTDHAFGVIFVCFHTGLNFQNLIEKVETIEDGFVFLVIIMVKFVLTTATSPTIAVWTPSYVHLFCLRCVLFDPRGTPTPFWVRSRSLQDRRPIRLRMMFCHFLFSCSRSSASGILRRHSANGAHSIFVSLWPSSSPWCWNIPSYRYLSLSAPSNTFVSLTPHFKPATQPYASHAHAHHFFSPLALAFAHRRSPFVEQ